MSKPTLHVPVGDLCGSLIMSTHNELCIPAANRLLVPVLAVAMPIMSTHNELFIPKANRLLALVLAVTMPIMQRIMHAQCQQVVGPVLAATYGEVGYPTSPTG